jgi:HlyD family secretion protein
MDTVIKKKKWNLKKLSLSIATSLLFILSVYWAASSREKTFRTERSRVSIASVSYDDFQDMVSFQGTVEPTRTTQLDASEGGIVEEIFVEEGNMVENGQALMRLSNASLRLDFMNRETQIVEQINNLRSTRITLDQNKRQVQEQLVDLNYNLKEQSRQFKLDSSLFADSVISKNDYESSLANYVYLLEKRALLEDRLNTDEAYRRSQLSRIDASVEMMERNLDAIRANLENLIVRAPISGQLNSFDHEIGQTKNRGENLGRIDQLEDYLISAQVDQYYLNRIALEQTAKATFSGSTYEMRVDKIFPTIVNSQFEVQLTFVDSLLPANIRRGQNVQLRLELSATKKALLVPRGSFSQSNGGKYVYVLEGNEAYRREVKLGSQNPEFIEIIEGLSEGEQIITSSYSSFGDTEKIILTQ